MYRLMVAAVAIALAVPAYAQTDLVAQRGDNRGTIDSTDRALSGGSRYDLYTVTGPSLSIVIPADASTIPIDVTILDANGDLVNFHRWTPGDEEVVLSGDGDRFLVMIASGKPGSFGGYRFKVAEEPPPPPPPPPPPAPEGNKVPSFDSVPKASRSATIQQPCLSNGSVTYGQLFERIRTILDRRGYSRSDQGWFIVPGGIAITTKFERISDDGRPIMADRFNAGPFYNSFWQIVSSEARPGRYRSTMVVYGKGVRQQDRAASFGGAINLTDTGDQPLPPALAALRSAAGNTIQVLVYEYARPSLGAQATLVTNGLLASNHLKGTGLDPAINKICQMNP